MHVAVSSQETCTVCLSKNREPFSRRIQGSCNTAMYAKAIKHTQLGQSRKSKKERTLSQKQQHGAHLDQKDFPDSC